MGAILTSEEFDPNVPAVQPLAPGAYPWMREAARHRREREILAAACRHFTVTQRFVVDNNAYKVLVADEALRERIGLLCLAGHIELLVTDIQHEENLADPDAAVAWRVLCLPWTPVPAGGVVPGLTRPNMARVGQPHLLDALRGPGSDPVPPWPKVPEVPEWDASRTEAFRRRGNADALVALTAYYERAVLVTDDKRMIKRVNRAAHDVPIALWRSAQLVAHLNDLAAAEGC